MAAIRGEPVDRVPVCLHNFLIAAREAAIPLEKALTDPETCARMHLEAAEKYGHDCLLIDLDTTLLAEAMGAKRNSTPDRPGHIAEPAIQELAEAENLPVVDPKKDGRIPVLLETIRILRREAGGKIAIRGNADQCAFSLAALLRGMEDFFVELLDPDEEEGVRLLLEKCYQSHLAVHIAVAEAGADFTSLGDSTSGPDVVSPGMFEKFAMPYQTRLVKELAERGIFTVLHICGNTSAILDRLERYPDCGFELDYKTDMAQAKQKPGREHVLFGNVDPSGVLARGSVEEVRAATRRTMEAWAPGGRFVLNAGCALPAETPSENVHAMMEEARLG